MRRHDTRSQRGSALMLAIILALLMALIGIAALDTVTRDLQVAGAQFRKKTSFYAAEAAVAQALETLRNAGLPSVTPTALGDSSTYPFGQPAFSLDTSTAEPIKSLGIGGFPGMNLQLGQDGAAQFQREIYRVRVQGTGPGGSLSRLEIASGTLVTN